MRTRLLAWLAFTFVLVDIACSATHFAIRDGNIEEIGSSKAVDVDPPPPAQKRLPVDRKKPRAAKRDNAARARKPIVGATTLWPAVKLMKGWQNGSPGTYALSVLNPRSFFSISRDGRVFERFFNGANWVFVRHENPSPWPLTGVTALLGTVFVSDSEGQLFQRVKKGEILQWAHVNKPGSKVVAGGSVSSSESSIVFCTTAGSAIERVLSSKSWLAHGHPKGSQLAAVVDARVLKDSVFFVGSNGRLYELTGQQWQDHNSPGSRLAALPGTPLKDTNSGVGSLFLVAQDGRLVERWFNRQSAWEWISHGLPPGAKVASPPAASKGTVFLVGDTGELFERFWDGKWQWRAHGSPPNTDGCAHVRPVLVSSHSVFCSLVDGRLSERVLKSNRWSWVIHAVPEGSSEGSPAQYCSANPLSPYNCIKGHEAIVGPGPPLTDRLDEL